MKMASKVQRKKKISHTDLVPEPLEEELVLTNAVSNTSDQEEDEDYEDAGDADVDDESKLAKLWQSVQELDGKKGSNRLQKRQRSEATSEVSEFNLSQGGKEHVRLIDLVVPLKRSKKYDYLKQQLKATTRPRTILQTPLPKPEAERIQRGLAYTKVTSEVSKWDGVVEKNRTAEQLIFPLKQPDLRTQPAEKFVEKFQIKTPLEIEVAKLLQQSDNNLGQDKELTRAEEEALKAMSIEEARERHRELQKMRALLSYQEAKARRQKKIKSKSYHRILKRERLRKALKEFEELKKTNPELAAEKLKELDKQRIQERMTLKHKSTGKWAKQQKLRAKYDDTAREALMQQLELNKQLTQKAVVVSDSEEEGEGGENAGDAAADAKEAKMDKFFAPMDYNPWLRNPLLDGDKEEPAKNEEEKVERKEDKEDDGEGITEVGGGEEDTKQKKIERRKTKKSKSLKKKKAENVKKVQEDAKKEDENEDDQEEGLIESLDRKQTMDSLANIEDEDAAVLQKRVDRIVKEKEKEKAAVKRKVEDQNKVEVDPTKFVTLKSKPLKSAMPDIVNQGDENLDDEEDEQRMLIAEAFADENIVEEFRKEKEEVVEADKPKAIDLSLPGWGSWAGTGIVPSKRKKKRFIIKPKPAPPRQDRKLGNVIINEKKDEKIAKHMVSELPFPFRNVQQFESSIRQPLGRTWTPESSFEKMTAPTIVTKMGKIIDPIDSDALLLRKKPKKNSKKEPFDSSLPIRIDL